MSNGIMMYGSRSKYLYGLVIDFDFSAMYPNSIVAFNIFATSLIGKVYIFHVDLPDPYDEDLGKEYIEDLIAGDLSFIGTKWHNLSTYDELSNRIKEKYNL